MYYTIIMSIYRILAENTMVFPFLLRSVKMYGAIFGFHLLV